MNNPDVLVAVRILLTLAGGGFITRGYFTAEVWSQIVGAVLTLMVAGWAWWSNRPKSKEAQQLAEKVAESSSAPDIVKLEPNQNVVTVDPAGRRQSDVVPNR